MSDFDRREECPHCDDAPPSRQLGIHIARTHADLPPCTARIETEHRETYRCAFRAGHEKGEYGRWHASKGDGKTGSRYVWNDDARGATPHRPPEPSGSLDKLKAMGVLSHTIVAASEGDPESGNGMRTEPEQPMSRRCVRPECGGEQHTDPWGTPVQCPHAEPAVQEDTGRRCPRCDCPDGHEQCQHCKICPHADPDTAARLDFARQYARVQRDHWQRRLEELDRHAEALANKEAP
jgi:hypothetical protein